MVVLLIMDGLGERKATFGNAVKTAKTPFLLKLKKEYPFTTLNASEEYVGLIKGEEGNSEAGHLNIGAGKIVKQDLKRINDEIASGDFEKNKVMLNAFSHVKKNDSSLHILGLLSSAGVHSKIEHLKEILRCAKNNGVLNVYLHLFSDGRDTPVMSGLGFATKLEKYLKKLGIGKIASIGGRVYGMDREKRWDRVEIAYHCIVNSASKNDFKSASELFTNAYKNNITDEFILPSTINGGKKIENGDAVIFFNYRSDRAREMTEAICEKEFKCFKRRNIKNLYYVGMTQYNESFKQQKIMFPPKVHETTLGEAISKAGLNQFRVSETTKYAHVTFFVNGGVEKPSKGEQRCLVETKNIKSFDEFPQMRAREITEKVVEAINLGKYGFILCNLSNCDMVGHTGNYDATVKAVEVVDECVGKIYEIAKNKGVDLIVTADHGNADTMLTKSGEKVTSHSLAKVPFILASEKNKNVKLADGGKLSNIAPTVLKLLNIKPPKSFTEKALF